MKGSRGVVMWWAASVIMFSLTDSRGAAEVVVRPSEDGNYPGGVPWKPPEGNSLWKIEIRRIRPQPHAHLLRQVRGLVVHQHGSHSMVSARYPDRSVEFWSDGAHAVVSVAGSGDVVEYIAPKPGNGPAGQHSAPEGGGEIDWLGLPQMREWEWVKPEHYRGRLVIDGVSLLVFSECDTGKEVPDSERPQGASDLPCGGGPAGALSSFPIEGVERAALVEERSRSPRVLQIGEEFWEYSFHTGPQPSFAFPDKVRRFLASLAPFFAQRVPLP